MTDPQPPHSPDAERAVLGAMIVDPSKIEEARGAGLRPGDFYDEGHGWVCRTLLDLEESGPDYVTLCDLLERRGQLAELGGRSEITALITACATSAHAAHYAKIVKLYATRRRLILAAGRIAEAAYEGKLEREELEERVKLLVAAAFAGDDEALGMTRPLPVKPKARSMDSVPKEPLVKGVLRE